MKAWLINILTFSEAYINPTYATNFLHVQKQNTEKMVYNVSFIDHVIRMVGRPLKQNGGYLCAKIFASMARHKLLLSMVYHQADGDYFNNTIIYSSFGQVLSFMSFSFLVPFVIHAFHCINKEISSS